MFSNLKFLIVIPALWGKKKMKVCGCGVISDLGNGYFQMTFSLSSHKSASKYESMVAFQY